MRKSHFNDEFLVLLGPIISSFLHAQMRKKINLNNKGCVLYSYLYAIHPSICITVTSPSISSFIHLSTCLSVYQFIYLSIHLSLYLNIHVCCQSVSLSAHFSCQNPFSCLSAYLSFYFIVYLSEIFMPTPSVCKYISPSIFQSVPLYNLPISPSVFLSYMCLPARLSILPSIRQYIRLAVFILSTSLSSYVI